MQRGYALCRWHLKRRRNKRRVRGSNAHGAPLRLIIPPKYGYKSIKTIVRLEFVSKSGAGYWSQFGYSPDATIQPGEDYPLDIGKSMEIKKPGELEY